MSKRIVFVALAALFALAGMAQKTYRYQSVDGDPLHTRIYTLANGLKIYLSENHEKPRVQTYIAVKTGSRNDPKETTGLAHYLEHLMFKGTTHFGSSNVAAEAPLLDTIQARFEAYRHITDPAARRKAYHEIDSISQLAARYNIPNEYDKLMASIGSEGSNAFTDNDVTCYQEDIPSNEIDTWAKVQADRFRNMVIRGFHTELEAVYEEYNISLASDGEKEWNALNKMLFPNHPYGTQSTIGTQEHLKNPSITNIKNYFSKYYVPNNIAICIAGDFNSDKVVAIIDKYFGSWKKSNTLSFPTFEPVPQLKAPVDTTVVGQEAENVFIGWKTKGAADFQTDTLKVIAQMLYNGMAGLFDTDLVSPMKVMWTGANMNAMHDYGVFVLQGMPKQGQNLEAVKRLMLGEVLKLKSGMFSDDLLPSVINNMKLSFYRDLHSNSGRAMRYVSVFINDEDFANRVHSVDRISKFTKKEIVDFAKRFFGDDYAVVYKVQGNDTTIHKIDKPEITPIPTNNDKQSAFLKEIVNTKPTPIQPKFVNFKHDLTVTKTKHGLDYLYKQNKGEHTFTLTYRYPFGEESDKRYGIAANYIDYVGNGSMTNEQIKQQFYKLACSYNIRVDENYIVVTLSGLSANMQPALTLLENMIDKAKADNESYEKYVDLVLKNRADNKTSQRSNFYALRALGQYGSYNSQRNIMSEDELKQANPQDLLNLLKDLQNHKHTLLYNGPASLKEVNELVSKVHVTPNTFEQAPASRPYLKEQTPQTEVWVAPYDAKNIYMTMYHNDGKKFSVEKAAVEALFNEYFGGGMNAIVFQELREARGLAYSASASYARPYYHPYRDTESFSTFIISQNDKMMDCINEFNALLNNMPAREANFELAKQSLLKSLSSMRITRSGILTSYLNAKNLGIDYDINQRIYNELPRLKLSDLVDFARENIANKPFRYLILGDEKNLDMNALEKLGPVRHVTTKEIFGY